MSGQDYLIERSAKVQALMQIDIKISGVCLYSVKKATTKFVKGARDFLTRACAFMLILISWMNRKKSKVIAIITLYIG